MDWWSEVKQLRVEANGPDGPVQELATRVLNEVKGNFMGEYLALIDAREAAIRAAP